MDIKTNRQFTTSIIDADYLLDAAIEWIVSNLSPDDVFTCDDLCDWAENNGFKSNENQE